MINQQDLQKISGAETEIDINDYLKVIWHRRKSVLIIFFAIVAISIILAFLWPKTYQSSSLLEIGAIRGNYLESPKDAAALFKQPTTLRALAKKIDLPEIKWPELSETVKVAPAEKFLEIKAEDKTPLGAKKIVDEAINLVLERHQKILAEEKNIITSEIAEIKVNIQNSENRVIEAEKELNRFKNPRTEAEGLVAQSLMATLNGERKNVRDFKQALLDKERELNYSSRETRIESPSNEPLLPSKPKKKIWAAVGAIIGLSIAIGYAFIAEYRDKNKKII